MVTREYSIRMIQAPHTSSRASSRILGHLESGIPGHLFTRNHLLTRLVSCQRGACAPDNRLIRGASDEQLTKRQEYLETNLPHVMRFPRITTSAA